MTEETKVNQTEKRTDIQKCNNVTNINTITSTSISISDTNNKIGQEADTLLWGLSLKHLYRLSLAFYKEKEGKALHLSYEDKLKLIAYTQQAAHGPFNEKTASPLGVLDVIGRDRRAAWAELANISQQQAMVGFVNMLDRLCPLFKPYVEANKKDSEDNKHSQSKEIVCTKDILIQEKKANDEQIKLEQQKANEEEQIRRIKDALNAQTYEQFLQYASQQFPGNPDQQAILVRQLQDQHYHQYIQQLGLNKQINLNQKQYIQSQNNKINTAADESGNKSIDEFNNSVVEKTHIATNTEKSEIEDVKESEQSEESHSDEDGNDGYPTIASASLWTREGVQQFKQTIRNAGSSGGVLQVGHGETITVRVPTHEGGRCLFWEFATDNFDIGFGVYFEWNKSSTTQVTVHVAESDDEGDLDLDNDEYDDEEIVSTSDIESGELIGGSQSTLQMLKPPISTVIPIYRRDSHLEVYIGSHVYPGEGVYLLKFDNTYSLWRSKTLYYRVYYTR